MFVHIVVNYDIIFFFFNCFAGFLKRQEEKLLKQACNTIILARYYFIFLFFNFINKKGKNSTIL